MPSSLWRNRLPANRAQNDRWNQFLEVLEETWQAHLTPQLERLEQVLSLSSNAEDRELRMQEWGARFLATASHLAPEIGVQQVQSLNLLKNTTTLWKAYGRQLGFENEDIEVEAKQTTSNGAYKKGVWTDDGRIPTSRISLVLSLRNARWYSQPISSPANLLQTYAEQTRPAHLVIESPVMEAPEDIAYVYQFNYSGYEYERTCRISL
jgi:glycine/D-amino acid oxidase-like deaminating enzyme